MNSKLHLLPLDGLRGIAILAVFLSHTSLSEFFPLPFFDFSGFGKVGVFLFFGLSSFLLCLPIYFRSVNFLSAHSLKIYSIRRILRIYPLFTLYLFCGLVTTVIFSTLFHINEYAVPFRLSLGEFFEHLFLLKGFGVTWSIAVEFKFYLFLPFIACFFSFLISNSKFLLLAVYLSFLSFYYFLGLSDSTVNDMSLVPYLPIFISGAFFSALFCVFKKHSISPGYFTCTLLTSLCFFVLFFSIPSLFSVLFFEIPFNYFHHDFLFFGIVIGVLLFLLVVRETFFSRVLSLPIFTFVGRISFSFYLIHPVCIGAVKVIYLESYLAFYVSLILSIVLSWLSYQLIERRFIDISHSFK